MLVANRRMALDAGEADVNTGGKMSQLEGLKQAFLDPKTYILAIAYHGVVGAAGFQNFYPSKCHNDKQMACIRRPWICLRCITPVRRPGSVRDRAGSPTTFLSIMSFCLLPRPG